MSSPYEFLGDETMPRRGSVTLAVTEALRRAIVMMRLKPGDTIDKGAVCARLSVSRFPVSEALARLAGEGLVDILPQRGSRVSYVRIGDVVEYMLIRKALEGEAVRVLVGRNASSLVPALAANLAAQRQAVETDDREGFHAHDLAFHDLISDAMGFCRIKTVIDQARANLDRARRLIISPRRLGDSLSEHQAIFAAIDAGDTAGAERAVRAHIDSVMREFFGFAREHPDFFADGAESPRFGSADSFPYG